MKKFTLILLALLLVAAMTFSLAACEQDPCKDGHDWDEGTVQTTATCQQEGSLVKHCKNCDATTTETIAKIDHNYGELKAETAANCTTAGNKAYWQCSMCHKYFVADSVGKKVETTDVTVPATGHNYKLGETKGTKGWTWDGIDSAVAHFKCDNDGCPAPTKDVTATITSQKDGENIVYTATATPEEGKASVTDTVTVLDHDHAWGEPTWNWSEGYTTAEATFGCTAENCEITKTVTASGEQISKEETTKPDCTNAGENTYTATVEGPDGKGYTTEQKKEVPALGHDYENQPYESVGEDGHHQKCSRCETYNETETHTINEYKLVDGENHTLGCEKCDYEKTESHTFKYEHTGEATNKQHTVTCEHCEYTATENCEFDEGSEVCKKCKTDYSAPQQDKVTIHFHVPTNWVVSNLKLYAFVQIDEENVTILTEAYPGSTGWVKDDADDGWYTYELNVESGHINKDLYIIATDQTETYERKTSDLLVETAEFYISNRLEVFASKEAAENSEKEPTPGSDLWFVTGSFNGTSAGETTNTFDRVFYEGNEYTLTSTYNKDDQFKFKQNVSGWDTQIQYSNGGKWTLTAEPALDGKDIDALLTASDYSDFVVNYNCKLKFTFDPTAKTVEIHILEATGLPDKGDTSKDGIWINGEFKAALIKNNGADLGDGKLAEYWLGDGVSLTLAKGDKITIQWKGAVLKVYVQASSSGIVSVSADTQVEEVTVAVAGEFNFYLKDYSKEKPNNWVCEYAGPTDVSHGDEVPEGCDPIVITFGSNAPITIYLKDATGKPVGKDRFGEFRLYTFNNEAFGDWGGSVTNGVVASEMTGSTATVPGGWIFRWGTGYGTQTTNITNAIHAGKTYLIELKANSAGDSKVTELDLAEAVSVPAAVQVATIPQRKDYDFAA